MQDTPLQPLHVHPIHAHVQPHIILVIKRPPGAARTFSKPRPSVSGLSQRPQIFLEGLSHSSRVSFLFFLDGQFLQTRRRFCTFEKPHATVDRRRLRVPVSADIGEALRGTCFV